PMGAILTPAREKFWWPCLSRSATRRRYFDKRSADMQGKALEGYRLSPQQRRLWMLLRQGRNGSYQAKCAVAVKGFLEPRHLEAAAQNVIARHEILRTTFQYLPGMTIPIQVIEESGVISWQEDDISELDDRDSLIENFFHDASSPFDFEIGPL